MKINNCDSIKSFIFMDGVYDKKNIVNKYRKPGSSIKSSELQGELEQKILKADIEDIMHCHSRNSMWILHRR